jgi:hypothetical protein
MVLAGTALALPPPAWTQTRSLDAQIEPVRVKYGMPALAAAVVKKGEIVAIGAVGVRVYGTNIRAKQLFHWTRNNESLR